MTADHPAPPISIGGGAGGHVALTEDLDHASWTLERAAAEVDEAALQLRMAAWWLERARPDAVAGVGGIVSHTLHEVEDALHGVVGAAAVSADLSDAALRVAAVARAYEDAEAQARRRVGSSEWWGRLGSGLLSVGIVPMRLHTGVVLKLSAGAARVMAGGADLMGDAQNARAPYLGVPWKLGARAWRWHADVADEAGDRVLPDARLRITHLLNGATIGTLLRATDGSLGPLPTRYELNARSVAVLLNLLERTAGEPRYLGTTRVVGSRREVDAPSGVHDLVAGLAGIDPGGPGTVVIDTIVHPDGSRSHVARIPGTRDNGFANESTLDYASNVPATLGETSDTERLVLDALEAAGISPTEPVMLVGHSQGGIVATRIAASAGDRFAITHVVTAGSPTDRIGYPEDVQHLNLINERDLVPHLDGQGARDLPHVTTVTGDLPAAEDPALIAAAGGIASSHAVSSYAATARAADASTHHSMKAWRAGAADYLNDGQVTRREYAPTFSEPVAVEPESTGSRERRGRRASGPGRRPWPGDLTAACESPSPGRRRGPRPPARTVPDVTGLVEPGGLLSPTLGTVTPMPTGDTGPLSPGSLPRWLP